MSHDNSREGRAAQGAAQIRTGQYVGHEIRHGRILRKVVLQPSQDPGSSPRSGRSGQKARDPEQLEGRASRREGCFKHLCPVCMAAAGETCKTTKGDVARTHSRRRQVAGDTPFGGGKP